MTETHVFLGDQHVPFHDTSLEAATLEFVRDLKPTAVHLLGDLVDFYQLSSHLRDPARNTDIAADLSCASSYLGRLRAHMPTGAALHYTEGNHETRLQRYLWQHADKLAGLDVLCLPQLLDLEKHRVTWHPDFAPYQIGSLWVRHGSRISPHSAYTARMELERAGACVIHGHTHRLGSHYKTQLGNPIGAWENGCLCKIDPAVHRYTNGPPNWQQGFSVAFFHGKYFSMTQVPVIGVGRHRGFLWGDRWYAAPATGSAQAVDRAGGQPRAKAAVVPEGPQAAPRKRPRAGGERQAGPNPHRDKNRKAGRRGLYGSRVSGTGRNRTKRVH